VAVGEGFGVGVGAGVGVGTGAAFRGTVTPLKVSLDGVTGGVPLKVKPIEIEPFGTMEVVQLTGVIV